MKELLLAHRLHKSRQAVRAHWPQFVDPWAKATQKCPPLELLPNFLSVLILRKETCFLFHGAWEVVGYFKIKSGSSFPAPGCHKLIVVDNKCKLRTFYKKDMAPEVVADTLGEDWKGFVVQVRNDKQGFPTKQGVSTNCQFVYSWVWGTPVTDQELVKANANLLGLVL